jgi:hypothetical protein
LPAAEPLAAATAMAEDRNFGENVPGLLTVNWPPPTTVAEGSQQRNRHAREWLERPGGRRARWPRIATNWATATASSVGRAPAVRSARRPRIATTALTSRGSRR